MKRRTFIKGIGLLTGALAATANGIRVVSETAKDKLSETCGIRAGDPITIALPPALEGVSYTVISSDGRSLTIKNESSIHLYRRNY